MWQQRSLERWPCDSHGIFEPQRSGRICPLLSSSPVSVRLWFDGTDSSHGTGCFTRSGAKNVLCAHVELFHFTITHCYPLRRASVKPHSTASTLLLGIYRNCWQQTESLWAEGAGDSWAGVFLLYIYNRIPHALNGLLNGLVQNCSDSFIIHVKQKRIFLSFFYFLLSWKI